MIFESYFFHILNCNNLLKKMHEMYIIFLGQLVKMFNTCLTFIIRRLKMDYSVKLKNCSGIIGAIGAVAALGYFVVSTSSGFNTSQIIQILFIVFAGIGAMMVGFVKNNSSSTYFLSYGGFAICFLLYSYVYFNSYVQHNINASSKWWYLSSMGQAIFGIICTIVLIYSYLCVTQKVKGKLLAIIGMSVLCGGFFFNFIVNVPQKIYSYVGRSDLSSGMPISLKQLLVYFLQYVSYISIFVALILMLISLSVKENASEDEA